MGQPPIGLQSPQILTGCTVRNGVYALRRVEGLQTIVLHELLELEADGVHVEGMRGLLRLLEASCAGQGNLSTDRSPYIDLHGKEESAEPLSSVVARHASSA